MAQQYPPNGGRGGHTGRGPPTGGRGPGRGISPPQQGQQHPYNYNPGTSRDAFRPAIGAWQATQPTSLQQAAGYPGAPPPQQGQTRQVPAGGYVPPMTGMPYYNPYSAAGAPQYGQRTDPSQWQVPPPAYGASPHQQTSLRYFQPGGGAPVVNAMPTVPIPQAPISHPPPPREKKPLTITDKQGNLLVFPPSQKTAPSSLQAAAAAVSAPAPPVKPVSTDAGAKMREAALERIKAQSTVKSQEVEVKHIEKEAEFKDTELSKEKPLQDFDQESKVAEEQAKHKADEDARMDAEKNELLESEAKLKVETEKKSRLEAEAIRLEKEQKDKIEAEEKARLEVEGKAHQEAQEAALREIEACAEIEAEGQSKDEKEQSILNASIYATNVLSNEPKATTTNAPKRIVLTKADLMRFKDDPQCSKRPDELPDMSVARSQNRDKAAGGGASTGGGVGGSGGATGGDRRNRGPNRGSESGGNNWERGSAPPRRQSEKGERNDRGGGGGGGGGGEWSRGHTQPRQQNQNQKGRGGRGGGRGGHHQPPLYDGPVAPLLKSENHWKPRKNTSALVVAEKKVKALLNKMTKEKFDRLSEQMLEIPISSYEILTMMIDNVYDKAIDEPRFGDMYADLCVRLSQSVQGTEFVHIIESDEEPPTEDGTSADVGGESSSHTVYRWSNDISTSDSEVVGPLPSADACIDAALDDEEHTPIDRGEMELELVRVIIKRSIFIKIMKKKDKAEEEEDMYYALYFPVSEAEELGQSLSGIFLSQVECEADASKKNSFKRSLLNKCEEEFNKKDIYVDWKKEKREYEESKSRLTEMERKEKEDELNFRRIRIKKQMLGNVQFIGQLYKKRLLKEKIMRYCIASLLLLEEDKSIKGKNPEYTDAGLTEGIDEEDHEAICSLFATIGLTIDKSPAVDFMTLCFNKIRKLSTDKALPSRSRFMYKDLMELRQNAWVPRRKEEKAKTIAEIRKEVELEERKQAEESARANNAGGDFRNSWTGGDTRGSSNRNMSVQSNRPRQAKPTNVTDDDGFTTVVATKSVISKVPSARSINPRIAPPAPSMSRPTFTALADEKEKEPLARAGPAPLSEDDLNKLIKRMRSDFINDGGNVTELMLNLEDIAGSPGYGIKIVSNNVEQLFESREEVAKAITRMIIVLCEKGKLTKDDVHNGIASTIEFIDNIVVDSPRAYEYLGNLLGEMLHIKAIDIIWLCDQLEKTRLDDPDTIAPEKVLLHSLIAFKRVGGKDSLITSSNEKRIQSLISAEKWKAIQDQL